VREYNTVKANFNGPRSVADGSRKKRFMSHFSLTANTQVFLKRNEMVGNRTKMRFYLAPTSQVQLLMAL
jgi:hypothetical protein